MRKGLYFAAVLVIMTGACTDPLSRITPTNLGDQALGDLGRASGTDQFVTGLNEVQEKMEENYLKYDDVNKTIVANAIGVNENVLQKYIKGRQTQINDLCNIYFQGLFKRSQVSDLGTGLFSIAANAASAVLGLTGAAAQQLAFLALGEASVLDSVDKYEEIYLLAPSPEIVQGLVKKAQKKFIEESAVKITDIEDYSSARNYVRNYAATCTPIEIRKLIDEAIAGSEVTFERANRTQSAAKSAELNLIANYVKRSSVTLDEAAKLYIAYASSGASSAKITAIKTELGDIKPDANREDDLKSLLDFPNLAISPDIRKRAGELLNPASGATPSSPTTDGNAPTNATVTTGG